MRLRSSGPIFAAVLSLTACADYEERSVVGSHSQSCVNGVCSTSSSESTTTTKVVSSGVRVVAGVPVIAPPGVLFPGNVVGSAGVVAISPCSSRSAPLSACDRADVSVLSPKHLGCTASGAQAWSCQDTFSEAPPFPVVVCSGLFSDSCTVIGSMY